jgi:hypothetical protein
MLKKIGVFLMLLSIILAIILILDKNSELEFVDSARILIGLSDKDSSQCNACSIDGKYFLNGCKHCEQDGIFMMTHTSQGNPYSTGWGNNEGLYIGDENCSGQKNFKNTKAVSGDTYGVKIEREGIEFQTTLYTDQTFSEIFEDVSVTMCSEPTDLRFFRISTEDGNPAGDGGRILGYIDDIKLWEGNELIFDESFDSCMNKTCENKWFLNNPDMIYIDPINKNLFFDSQVTGTNDNIHHDLGKTISDESWTLRFILHIEEFDEYPKYAGFIPLDKISRVIVFWIPIFVLPIISVFLLKNIQDKKTKSLLISNVSLIIIIILMTILKNIDL